MKTTNPFQNTTSVIARSPEPVEGRRGNLQQFTTLPDIEFPSTLHGRIMRRVSFARWHQAFRIAALTGIGSVLISLGLIMVTSGVWDLVGLFFEDIEWSWAYVADFSAMILDVIPEAQLLLFVGSLVAAVMSGWLFIESRETSAKHFHWFHRITI